MSWSTVPADMFAAVVEASKTGQKVSVGSADRAAIAARANFLMGGEGEDDE